MISMKNAIDKKLRFLRRHFHFKKNELGAIRSYYAGEFFDPEDPAFRRLLALSQELCERYRVLSEELPNPHSYAQQAIAFIKKRHILTRLFIHPSLSLLAGPGLQLVIGAVELEKVAYFNNDVLFHPSCLVHLSNRIRFGPNIEVGDSEWERQGNLVRASQISFGEDCWIGYGAKIKGGIALASGTLLAAGAYLSQSTRKNALMVSRPAQEKAILDEDYCPRPKESLVYSPHEKKILFQTLSKLGLRRSWNAYERYLSGASVNIISPALAKVFLISHQLCREYSLASTTAERQNEIKQLLFPLQGQNFVLEKGLWLDILGAVRVGNNVRIGEDAYLSGNLLLEDNVTLGQEVTMFASGHPLRAEKRRFFFSFRGGFHEEGQLYSIVISKGITLGDHAVIAPSTIVEENVPENGLYAGRGLVS